MKKFHLRCALFFFHNILIIDFHLVDHFIQQQLLLNSFLAFFKFWICQKFLSLLINTWNRLFNIFNLKFNIFYLLSDCFIIMLRSSMFGVPQSCSFICMISSILKPLFYLLIFFAFLLTFLSDCNNFICLLLFPLNRPYFVWQSGLSFL